MEPPGGMAHCVIDGTPSLKGVSTCTMPCQCSVVASASSALTTVTSTQSPSSTTSAGPGTVPFAAT